MEKLQLITDKIGSFEDRLVGLEGKLHKKAKVPKSKGTKDISNVHIFPFDEDSEFVKMALLGDKKHAKEFYPVIELLKMDFEKLAKLVVDSEILSVQWSDFNNTDSVAKYENNQLVLCT